MKFLSTTAMSVPLDEYSFSHSCSKEREKPTSATNAPMAMPMPSSVSSVRKRRRPRFFHANPAKESWDGMVLDWDLGGDGVGAEWCQASIGLAGPVYKPTPAKAKPPYRMPPIVMKSGLLRLVR